VAVTGLRAIKVVLSHFSTEVQAGVSAAAASWTAWTDYVVIRRKMLKTVVLYRQLIQCWQQQQHVK